MKNRLFSGFFKRCITYLYFGMRFLSSKFVQRAFSILNIAFETSQ